MQEKASAPPPPATSSGHADQKDSSHDASRNLTVLEATSASEQHCSPRRGLVQGSAVFPASVEAAVLGAPDGPEASHAVHRRRLWIDDTVDTGYIEGASRIVPRCLHDELLDAQASISEPIDMPQYTQQSQRSLSRLGTQ